MSFKNQKITVGLAMSGAAARSVFYIGFLEALEKHNIEIDFITSYSGAAIVSAAYATGRLELLRDEALALNSKTLFSLVSRSKTGGGWYSLEPFEEFFREKYSLGLKMESVKPRLSFLATDLESKRSVELSLGDIARAVRISCSMPGVFEPMKWGKMVLVDGGLGCYVPGNFVRSAGADVVIGVQVRSNKYFFIRNEKVMDTMHETVKKFSFLNKFGPWINKLKVAFNGVDLLGYMDELVAFEDEDKRNIGTFSILGRCLDIAVEANQRQKSDLPNYGCDLLISTGVATATAGVKIHEGRKLYEQGLAVGNENAQKIINLIKLKQLEKNKLYARS